MSTMGLTYCTPESTTANPESVSKQEPFALEEFTVSKLQQEMQNGSLTAREITEMYLERIKEVDEDQLNSVIEVTLTH